MSTNGVVPPSEASKMLGRVIARAEDGLYAIVSFLIVISAVIVLIEAGHSIATETDDGVRGAIEHALDSLLIVFILIELLSAVRVTIIERHLVAEPFLVVGIIASIKEIVVASVFADESAEIEKTVLHVGVLGAVVLVLSVASLLLRRKEREPSE